MHLINKLEEGYNILWLCENNQTRSGKKLHVKLSSVWTRLAFKSQRHLRWYIGRASTCSTSQPSVHMLSENIINKAQSHQNGFTVTKQGIVCVLVKRSGKDDSSHFEKKFMWMH